MAIETFQLNFVAHRARGAAPAVLSHRLAGHADDVIQCVAVVIHVELQFDDMHSGRATFAGVRSGIVPNKNYSAFHKMSVNASSARLNKPGTNNPTAFNGLILPAAKIFFSSRCLQSRPQQRDDALL